MLKPNQISIGMRVAVFVFNQWDRAEVLSEVNAATGMLKLFFIDFGTTGFVNINQCKMLIEDFAVIPRQAIRAALHGVKPARNNRLWSLNVTHNFISLIRNKIHKIEIVKHHEHVSDIEFGLSNV